MPRGMKDDFGRQLYSYRGKYWIIIDGPDNDDMYTLELYGAGITTKAHKGDISTVFNDESSQRKSFGNTGLGDSDLLQGFLTTLEFLEWLRNGGKK